MTQLVSGARLRAISGNNLRNQAEFSACFKFSWQERLLRASQLTKPRFLGVEQQQVSFPRADCPAPLSIHIKLPWDSAFYRHGVLQHPWYSKVKNLLSPEAVEERCDVLALWIAALYSRDEEALLPRSGNWWLLTTWFWSLEAPRCRSWPKQFFSQDSSVRWRWKWN